MKDSWIETMYDYLVKEPKARERANKNRAIGNLIGKKYGKPVYNMPTGNPNLTQFSHFDFDVNITKEVIADLVGEVLTADRAWRKVLEANPELRGNDYNEKEKLELEAQLKLGYR